MSSFLGSCAYISQISRRTAVLFCNTQTVASKLLNVQEDSFNLGFELAAPELSLAISRNNL